MEVVHACSMNTLMSCLLCGCCENDRLIGHGLLIFGFFFAGNPAWSRQMVHE